MPILTSDFPALCDDVQEIFEETASQKVNDNVGFTLFDVFDTDRQTYDHLVLHGIAGIKKVTPGQDLPKVTGEEGDSISWTQEYFGAEAEVTKAMRKFDLHGKIDSVMRSISEDAFDKVDQSLADRLIHGWDTSYTDVYGSVVSALGVDGLCLFHATHTNGATSRTYTNIISDGTNTNPALSREAITHMRALGRVNKDANGLSRSINYSILVVPPSLEDLAERICNTQLLPGSSNNDKNPLYGKMKVVVWERLETASDSTDASAYWFLMDPRASKETLKCLFAERPSLDAPEQVYDNKNWGWTLDYFYAIGVGYPAYIAGSKGDKS
jgi:hypothetical protein